MVYNTLRDVACSFQFRQIGLDTRVSLAQRLQFRI